MRGRWLVVFAVCGVLLACGDDDVVMHGDAGRDADEPMDDAGHDANLPMDAGRDADDEPMNDAQADTGADAAIDDEDASTGCVDAVCTPCGETTCGSGGRCVMSVEGPVCLCDAGFTGDDCAGCAAGYAQPSGSSECYLRFVETDVLAAGDASCEFGGVSITRGLDLDRDGTLDGNESDAPELLCSPEPARICIPPAIGCACTADRCGDYGACLETTSGAACLCDGGYAGSVCGLCEEGYTRAGNGTCAIPQQLQRTRYEPRGDNCPAGGSATTIAYDVNHNATIDLNESPITTYQCYVPMIRNGNITVSNLAQLQDLAGVTEISGTLTITAPSITNLDPLSSLTWAKTLTISGNTLLTDISALDSLERVDTDLVIEDNAALGEINGFGQLQAIGGALTIRDNASLDAIGGFNTLQSVVGALAITNPTLTTITGFQTLRAVGSDFSIVDSPLLTGIEGLAQLEEVGSLLLLELPSLDSVAALYGLVTCRGIFRIQYTGVHEIDGFNALIEVRNMLLIRNNDEMTTFSGFNALEEVRYDNGFYYELAIDDNLALLSVDAFHAVRRVSRDMGGGNFVRGAVSIVNNTQLESFHALDVFEDAEFIDITGSRELTDLVGLDHVVYGSITLLDLPVTALSFSHLTTGRVTIQGARVTTLSFPLLRRGWLTITNMPLLTAISAPVLDDSERVRLLYSPLVTTLDLPVLADADWIEVDGFAGTSLGQWPALTHVASLRIGNCPHLIALPNAPLLSTMTHGGGLDIHDNAALTGLGFTALTQIGDCDDPQCQDGCSCHLMIRANAALPTCRAQAFATRVGISADIQGNNDAATCN